MSQNDGEEKELNPMEQALQVFSEEYRKDEMLEAAQNEMSINNYKVEPATNQCLTDFVIMQEVKGEDIQAYACGDRTFGIPPTQIPLNYYDNDDGFWDDYIA